MEKNFKKHRFAIIRALEFIDEQLEADYKNGHYYVLPLRAIIPVLYRWSVFRFGKMSPSEIESLKSDISVAANDMFVLTDEE